MKKLVSALLFAAMLIGCLSLAASAAAPRKVNFYMSYQDEGKNFASADKGDQNKTFAPGDTFTVHVYMSENEGTWASKFEIHYDTSVLSLSADDVEYVYDVFTKSEVGVAIPNDEKGLFTYYADYSKLDDDNYRTGEMVALTFHVKDNAINTSKSEMVKMSFPDNGVGWFISTKDYNLEYDVACVNKLTAMVSGSDNTSAPATEKDGLISETNPNKKPPVAVQTDDKGNVNTDAEGNPETYVINDDKNVHVAIVTDDSGNAVTDDSGNFETYYVASNGDPIDPESVDTDTDGNLVTEAKTTTAAAAKDDTKGPGSLASKLIIAGSIAAVVAAAVIIIVVVTKKSKKDSDTEE